MINKQAVLEHIAQATGKSSSEVDKAVAVEYWKNIVDFTSSRGVDLYADYLRSQQIKEVRGISRLSIKIPLSKFQEAATSRDVADFCIADVYASQFKRKYASDFNFIAS